MAVYGVTPMKVSIVETGKLANPEEQIEVANDTVRAEQQEAEAVINMKLIPLFKDSENLRFVFKPVEEKIDDQLKLKDMELKQAQIDDIYLRNKVITINELRAQRSFGEPVAWGQEPTTPDVPTLPFGLNQTQLTKAAKLMQKNVDRSVTAFYRALSEVNKKAKQETLALLKEEKSLNKKINEGILIEVYSVFAKALGRYSLIIRQYIDKEFKKSVTDVGQQLNLELNEKDFSHVIKALVEENMKGYLDLNGNWYPGIKGVNEELEETIKSVLQKAIREELSVAQTKELLKERFDVNDSRLQAIARTELNRASNKGAITGYKKSGVVKAKKWLTAKPRRTQDSTVCTRLDGQERELDEAFVDSQTGQKFNAPPAHPNCRSTIIPLLR
jgi:SPP1 gp7 family putative phage head morphogenesis protein